MKKILVLTVLWAQLGWGWGEVGHHLIGRTAVEILKFHPALDPTELNAKSMDSVQNFLKIFQLKKYQQGHLANIPDTYWRNLESNQKEVGNLLGSPTHFFDSEILLTAANTQEISKAAIPLSYADAKSKFAAVSQFFNHVGSVPWRAQQFTDLYSRSLSQLVAQRCQESKRGEELTREATTYAGLLSHFTGDVTMPYHASIDYDAIAVGQKGIHSYFEQDLVDELETADLYSKVVQRAQVLLTSPGFVGNTPSLNLLKKKSFEMYPQQQPTQRTSALILALLDDSYSQIEKLRQLDYTYSIASLDEALVNPACKDFPVVKELKFQYDSLREEQKKVFGKVKVLSQPSSYHDKKIASACRRSPSARVNQDGELSPEGKTVAQWHEDFILSRLALAAAVTADIWVHYWLQSQQPQLCFTYLYAHKPSFISPTDPHCAGYALSESQKDFLMENGKSALPLGKSPKNLSCVSF
jgi:hypothetical protein